jgi:hypothetical protein
MKRRVVAVGDNVIPEEAAEDAGKRDTLIRRSVPGGAQFLPDFGKRLFETEHGFGHRGKGFPYRPLLATG